MPQRKNEDDSPFKNIPTYDDHPAAAPAPTPSRTAEDVATAKALRDIASQPKSNTPFGQKVTGLSYQEIAENARRQLGTTESTRERVDPRVDKFSPTDQTADWTSEEAVKLYNDVGPGRAIGWKRKPGTYQGDRDEIADLMFRIPEAKIVTRKSDGEQVQSWDTVAVSFPDTHANRMILKDIENYEKWTESIDQETIHGSVTRHHPRFEERKDEAMFRAEERSRQMGIGQRGVSPGAGFGEYRDGYRKALSVIPIEETRSLEERERRGGRHVTADDREMRQLDENRSRGGRSQFGGLQGDPRYNRWQTSRDRENAERAGGRPSESGRDGGRDGGRGERQARR